MSLIKKDKCKIEFLNSEGLGVGYDNHDKIILPYTIPGEVIEFEEHKYRHQTNFLLTNIIETSSHRQIAPCKYFGNCGGCLLQHISVEEYHKYKIDSLNFLLEKKNLPILLNPTVIVPAGLRRRTMLFTLKKDEKIYLGFHRFRSHQIINIEECLVLKPQISELIPFLKSILLEILADRQQANIHILKAENGIDIALEFSTRQIFNHKQKTLLSKFATQNNIIKLSSISPGNEELIFFKEAPLVTFGDYQVEVDAKGFLQPSSSSDQLLGQIILEQLKPSNNKNKMVDLFCGRGTYTLPLSKYHNIDTYEIDVKALNALSKVVTSNHLPIKLFKRDLFHSPLNYKELNQYNYAVINPPRAGALAQCKELAASNIEKILYISCNPETFINDAKVLCAISGYKLLEITPIDQFYWSPHLELVAVFTKSEQ